MRWSKPYKSELRHIETFRCLRTRTSIKRAKNAVCWVYNRTWLVQLVFTNGTKDLINRTNARTVTSVQILNKGNIWLCCFLFTNVIFLLISLLIEANWSPVFEFLQIEEYYPPINYKLISLILTYFHRKRPTEARHNIVNEWKLQQLRVKCIFKLPWILLPKEISCRLFLARNGEPSLVIWTSEYHLSMLIWSFFVGLTAVYSRDSHVYFTSPLV